MKVQEFMRKNPAVCAADDTLEEAARLMCEQDCGSIPVVESKKSKKLVGIITDRDISCRGTAKGSGPGKRVQAVMSHPAVTVTPHTTLEECCKIMKDKQLRRLVVVDENGYCAGIVCQAHIARHASKEQTGEVVAAISRSGKYAHAA